MHFDFFKQRIKGSVSVNDEVAIFADRDNFVESGRYTVAALNGGEDGELLATFVGMGPLEGTFCQLDIGNGEASA
jgi:hypothetical protein